MPAASGIFAALKKVGDPPLQNGFATWQAQPEQPLTLAPGQWLISPDAPIGWLAQPSADTLLIAGPETLPPTIELQITGKPHPLPDQAILAGAGLAGLGGVLHAAQTWKGRAQLIALLQLDGLPFQPAPSRIWLPGMPSATIATLPLLEDWQIPCRIAADAPGCHEGTLATLMDAWRASGHRPDWPILYFGDC